MPRGQTPRTRRSPQIRGTLHQIVVIDQAPIRHAAGAKCAAAMARLDEARAAWHRFEREDKPSFARWRAREFGPLLSQAREVEVQVRDLETLVHEVEMEMRRGFMDAHGAYLRVMAQRGNPAAAVQEKKFARNDAGVGRSLSEFEKEALFQEWVHKSLGTNPDKMDDDAYSASFEAFKSHMFRAKPPESIPGPAQRPSMNIPAEEEEEETPELPTDARVKELYRLLVRRLHPDVRADGNVAASALWHEVQEAYAASDIAHLEILLALSDINADRFSDQTSVAQMHAVLAELKRALYALDDSLRQARNEDAWNFARAGAAAGLRLRVERELKANLSSRSDRLAMLKRTVAAWSRPAAGGWSAEREPAAEFAI